MGVSPCLAGRPERADLGTDFGVFLQVSGPLRPEGEEKPECSSIQRVVLDPWSRRS
jgi:hypothetical protein